MSHELHIPHKYPDRNPLNGRFNKGHIPHNTGKKWKDYMDKKTIRKLKKQLRENAKYLVPPDTSRKVVGIKDGKLYGIFKSATLAANHLGVNLSNIVHCCAGRQKTCRGYQWFYEEDDKWLNLINIDDEKTG